MDSTDEAFVKEILGNWLLAEMSAISETLWYAGWHDGLEFTLWKAVSANPVVSLGGASTYCGADRLERLKRVAEIADVWGVFDEEKWEMTIPLEEWKVRFAEHEATR